MTNGDKIRQIFQSDEMCAKYYCQENDCHDCPMFNRENPTKKSCIIELADWMGKEAKDE